MSEDVLDEAIARAKERGKVWLEDFKNRPYEERVDYLAQKLFYAIEHDPYGYPNGRPHWDEILDVDEDYKCGIDKWRYRRAALMAVKTIGYMGDENE
jgi:hypothetical protein